MHPLFNPLRGLAVYLLGWWLAGVALPLVWPALGADGHLPAALAFAVPLALLTGAAALAMYPVCRSLPFRPARWASLLGQRAVAALVLALLVSGVAAAWNLVIGTAALGRGGLVSLAGGDWLLVVAAQTAVHSASALVHDAVLAHEAARRAAAAELQARLHAREMEIKALRHQIDPHFLFNGLNSISALTQVDPAAARAMTIDLADFFRLTLRLGGRERIQLADELDLVRCYVAVEQRRLGDKLRLAVDVQADAQADCPSAWLPPLLLQPLVENAVKHGIRQLDDGGTVALRAHRVADRLVLQVRNPVDPLARRHDASGLGQGLTHLRQRLRALYGDTATVDVDTRTDDGHHTVHLTLPWQA